MELENEETEAQQGVGVNMEYTPDEYNLFFKNCLTYTNRIISRAEEIAEEAGESLEIK